MHLLASKNIDVDHFLLKFSLMPTIQHCRTVKSVQEKSVTPRSVYLNSYTMILTKLILI